MNIIAIDLDLDGLRAMQQAERRQRAWRRHARQDEPVPDPERLPREPRRVFPEPAWE